MLRSLVPWRSLGGLEEVERRTYRLHLLSTLAAAAVSGVTLNSEYIAANGLHASAWQITLLVMMWPVSNFLSVLINSFIEKRGSYRGAVIVAGLFRLPIAAMYFSSDVNVMLILIACFSAADSVMVPVLNTILRERYAAGRRGVLFGWAVSLFTLFSLPASLLVGRLLDADFGFYRILFIGMALAGFAHAMIFAGMASGLRSRSPTGAGRASFALSSACSRATGSSQSSRSTSCCTASRS